jgi:hypothetical protein
VLLTLSLTNLKKVFLCLTKSSDNQIKIIIIAVENGMHRILLDKDSRMSPLINAIVALPIPHPGQGYPVIHLKIHFKNEICVNELDNIKYE